MLQCKEKMTSMAMSFEMRRRIDDLRQVRARKEGKQPPSMRAVIEEAVNDLLERELRQ